MYRYILILLFSLFLDSAFAQPKFEVRAAWLTTAYALDWPKTKATTPETVQRQKDELITILDKLKAANFNTVLFQARLRADVIYPSNIETYDYVLTGHAGQSPGYDPLAFAVDECHKRGMECHAWMVTIPLGTKGHIASLGNRSVVKQSKELCVLYNNEYYLNPGHPKTKEYLMSLVREVVSNYDVDGVHFDYLRYPEYAKRFPDAYDYKLYSRGRTIDQWRRDNITEIVRYIYKGVKAMKPWVKVSTSPIGKYRDTSRYSSRGWNAFFTVYQDPQGWLGEGIQDQIYPMMYFKENNFFPFALDWKEQSNGRQVIPGLGIFFLDPKEGTWQCDEVVRQINFIRNQEMAGEGYYRAQYLVDNTQNIYDELVNRFYMYPALQPPMPWLDNVAPSVPTNLTKTMVDNGYTDLSWGASTDNDNRIQPMYVIYASDIYPVDITKPENIVAQSIHGTQYTFAPIYPWEMRKFFAVTAIDRYGNESGAVQESK